MTEVILSCLDRQVYLSEDISIGNVKPNTIEETYPHS